MTFRTRGLLLVSGLVLGPFSQADAQAVTGALAGRVLSPGSEPLENVEIVVSGPSLQGKRQTTSDRRGQFRFSALPAGTYSVLLRQIGFTPLRVTDATVALGTTTSLGDLQLSPHTVALPEIVMLAARPLLDPTSVANVTVLDSARFLALPTERNFRALLPLVPEASPSPYGDGTNVAGATGLENGYFVDGIHITDPVVADGGLNLPYNFVREVQITTGGYRAEYGRAQGGVVNVVTNSGGNELHGQVTGFFTSDMLRGTPRWGVGESQIEDFSQYDAGFGVGGPIRRDRVWFYAAYDPNFETSSVNLPGITAQRDARTTHSFAAKLTSRLGPASDATFTLLGDPSTRDFVGSSGTFAPLPANVGEKSAVLGRFKEGGPAAALQLRHEIGDRILLSLSLARLNRREDQGPRDGGAATDPASLARVDDLATNTATGNFGGSSTIHVSRTSGQVSMSLFTAGHTVKLGAEYEQNDGEGHGLTSIIQKTADTSYAWLRITTQSHTHIAVPTFYLQDSWTATQRLQIDAGLRLEGQFISGDTGATFWIAPELAPRGGAIYQPGEPGRQKLFASYGRFFEELPLLGAMIYTSPYSLTVTGYRQNPLVDSTGGTLQGGYSTGGDIPDRQIRGQQYDEWAVGYEHRLGRTYRFGVRGTYRHLRWAVEDAVKDTVVLVGNPGRGALAYLPRARRDYTALEFTMERAGEGPFTFLASYVLSRGRGNYTGLFATDLLLAAPNAGPQFDFPVQMVNANGLLPNDRTHVVKLSGSFRFPIGLTVGMSALLASGTPLSEYETEPFEPYIAFVQPRGTSGRTPTTWNLDLRFAYDVPGVFASRMRSRLLLDVFNVGNQRRPVTYEQLHYTQPGRTGVNPNYGAVTRYQAPRRARVGLVLTF
jgi:Carboxypeptidase regulatory-like domain